MAYQREKVKARQVVTPNTQTQTLGVVANVPMGDWNATTTYQKLNMVRYNGATYIATQANTGIAPTTSSVWQLVSADGWGVQSTAITYQAGISGTVPPTGEWIDSVPEVLQGKYLWTRIVTTYTDNTQTVGYSVSLQGLNFTQEDRDDITEIKAEMVNKVDKPTGYSGEVLLSMNNGVSGTYPFSSGLSPNSMVYRDGNNRFQVATPISDNDVANKAFVNSSINAVAAFYITRNAQGDAFPTKAELVSATTFYSGGKVRIPTQNDYATVLSDETQNGATTRYTYQTDTQNGTYPNGQWDLSFVVNSTALTQAQLDAINSGITSSLVTQINTNKNAIDAKATATALNEEITNRKNADTALQNTANKNLYNLGAYDTIVSNGDGTATITRKTGYWNSINKAIASITFFNYGGKAVFYPLPDSARKAVGSGETNGRSNYNYDYGVISNSGGNNKTSVCLLVDEPTIFINGAASETVLRESISRNPCFIEYELAEQYQYTEKVIDNQSIHTVNRNGDEWIREEWEDGLNLCPIKSIQVGQLTTLVSSLPAGTYTFTLYTEGYTGAGQYQIFYAGTNQTSNLRSNEKVVFTLSSASNLEIYMNDSATNSIMLTRGTRKYPYKPYKGKIVRDGGNVKIRGMLDLGIQGIITGQENATTPQLAKAHSIEMGVPGRDYLNFNEYGGDFRFYKTDTVISSSGDGNLLAKINSDGIYEKNQRVYSPSNPNVKYLDSANCLKVKYGSSIGGYFSMLVNLPNGTTTHAFPTSITGALLSITNIQISRLMGQYDWDKVMISNYNSSGVTIRNDAKECTLYIFVTCLFNTF